MKKKASIFSEKLNIQGKWVAIMNFSRKDRGIILTAFRTRCFKQHEIHEFILCGTDTVSNQPINEVSYLGFGEIIQGGIVEIGDGVYVKDHLIGTILGFDETHMPNHYNIIIETDKPITGLAMGIKSLEEFSIKSENNER